MCCTGEHYQQVAGRPCAHAAAADPAGPMRIRLLLTLLAAASAAQSGTEASGPQHVKARRWIWGLLQQPAGRALCGVDDVNAEEAHVLCTAEVGASVRTGGPPRSRSACWSPLCVFCPARSAWPASAAVLSEGHAMTATSVRTLTATSCARTQNSSLYQCCIAGN